MAVPDKWIETARDAALGLLAIAGKFLINHLRKNQREIDKIVGLEEWREDCDSNVFALYLAHKEQQKLLRELSLKVFGRLPALSDHGFRPPRPVSRSRGPDDSEV